MIKPVLIALLSMPLLAMPPAHGQSAEDALFEQANAAFERADYATARTGWETLANKGQSRAMWKLGWAYINAPAAWGLDNAKGIQWYDKCIQTGEKQCAYNLGWELASGARLPKDIARGLGYYRKAAGMGHAMAMTNIGWHHENGLGVAKDPKQAVDWYRKGAEAGNALGMSNLASMYLQGVGVAQDYQAGRTWAQKGADAGNSNAMNWMGVIHNNGWGVPVDNQKARGWFEKAIALGNEVAKNNLASLPPVRASAQVASAPAQSGNCPGDPARQEKSRKTMIEDAETEIPRMMTHLGDAYLHGEFCFPRDLKQARFWLEKAAAKGDEEARRGLQRLADLERQSQQSTGESARSRRPAGLHRTDRKHRPGPERSAQVQLGCRDLLPAGWRAVQRA